MNVQVSTNERTGLAEADQSQAGKWTVCSCLPELGSSEHAASVASHEFFHSKKFCNVTHGWLGHHAL